jgi:uridine kinase
MWMHRSVKVHALHSKVREAIGVKNRHFDPPLILGVCGGSGSGKTTFCNQFVQMLGRDRVIHLKQDDYYRDLQHLSVPDRANVNFDHPDAVEFDLLLEHVESLMAGHEVAIPKYDFVTHCRVHVEQIVAPKPVILIEGILLFACERLADRMDLKVFIDTPVEVRFDRRLHRDVRERGRSAESVAEQFRRSVLPMHEHFVEPSKRVADRVISGELPFEPHLYDIFGHIFMLKQSTGQLRL